MYGIHSKGLSPGDTYATCDITALDEDGVHWHDAAKGQALIQQC